LLLPPSLTAAGEPHPPPMERTSLTVSVGICASTEDVGRFSRDRCHHQSRIPMEIIVCVDHNDSVSSGADGTGRTGSTVSRSAVVVLANKYQGRLGSARNSAAKIARDDIIGDRLTAPSEEDSIGTQLLRGE
jgi:hypothetical protein